MNILYCSWGEITKEDAYQTLTEMGHQVDLLEYEIKDYNLDPAFSRLFLEKADSGNYDMVFSFDFVPLIAKLTFARKIRYAAWVFDPMPLTLYSVMAFSPYNYIFTFDGEDCKALRQKGISQVFHLPLAVNEKRIHKILQTQKPGRTEEADISFIGNLYNDRTNLFDSIEYLPDSIKDYIDSLVFRQMETPGNALVNEMVNDELAEKLDRYVTLEISDEYTWTHKDIYLEMILRNMAAVERQKLLKRLSEQFSVALYSGSDSSALPRVTNHGYIDYNTKMPLVIANSKVNLHITPRAITSGMSLRIFDIMGAGGFLLSNCQPELLEYFEEGKDFVAYRNEEDLIEKVSYYLEHDNERREIAANGKRKVNKRFTYEIQFQKMFEILERNIYV